MNGKTHALTRTFTGLAVLAAMGVVLAWAVRFPLIPSAAFLEYDAADIPILIGTFAYGTVWGLLLTVVVSILQGITVSAASGPIGIMMHVVATGALVLTAGLIYGAEKTRARAVVGLILGSVAMILVMIPLNLIITPMFMKVPVEVVKSMLLPAIIPFNSIKAGINSIVTFFVYKYVSAYIK